MNCEHIILLHLIKTKRLKTVEHQFFEILLHCQMLWVTVANISELSNTT